MFSNRRYLVSKSLLTLSALAIGLLFTTRMDAQNTLKQHNRELAKQTLNSMPVRFEPNKGQTSKGVDFISRGLNYHLALSGKGASFAFLQKEPLKRKSAGRHKPMGKITSTVLNMSLAGAHTAPKVQGE
ncbi:MAG: hypothetical protein NT023_03720, partial [Armatimonadetes bacterium]|nr:hypothetical protein [Armatimonadota bacterium]